MDSPHKWPVTREMYPFNDVIMDVPIIRVEPVKISAVSVVSVVCYAEIKLLLSRISLLNGILAGIIQYAFRLILWSLYQSRKFRSMCFTAWHLCRGRCTIAGKIPRRYLYFNIIWSIDILSYNMNAARQVENWIITKTFGTRNATGAHFY